MIIFNIVTNETAMDSRNINIMCVKTINQGTYPLPSVLTDGARLAFSSRDFSPIESTFYYCAVKIRITFSIDISQRFFYEQILPSRYLERDGFEGFKTTGL